jgi:hypothetical protein
VISVISWNLDQTVGWIEFRDDAFVEKLAEWSLARWLMYPKQAGIPFRDVETAEAVKRVSPQAAEAAPPPGRFIALIEGSQHAVNMRDPDAEDRRAALKIVPVRPVERGADYLVSVCRDGRLTARGHRNGRGDLDIIDKAQWLDLQIVVGRRGGWLIAAPVRSSGTWWSTVIFDAEKVRKLFRSDTPMSPSKQPLTEEKAKVFVAKYIKGAKAAGRVPSMQECETQAQADGYRGGRNFLRKAYRTIRPVKPGRPNKSPKQFAKK